MCNKKGEMSLEILSKKLREVYELQSESLKRVISLLGGDTRDEKTIKVQAAYGTQFSTREINYASNNKPTLKIIRNFNNLSLKSFFEKTDISKIGSYSSESDIFKKY